MSRITLTLSRDDVETIEAALVEYYHLQIEKVGKAEKEYRTLSDIQQAYMEPAYERKVERFRTYAAEANILAGKMAEALRGTTY